MPLFGGTGAGLRRLLFLPVLRTDKMKAAPNFGAALVRLFTKPELGDEVGVAAFILFAQIVEKTATLVDHHQQDATAVLVLCVRLEMLGQRVDAVVQADRMGVE